MEVFLGQAAGVYPNGRSNRSLNGTFILGTSRPEWRPPQELAELFESSLSTKDSCDKWGILISLAPLTDQATRELAMEIFQYVEDIPEQIIELLVERSEGVPYYAEEMVNWFIDHSILDTHGEQ